MSPLYLFVFTKIASTAGFVIAAIIVLTCLVFKGRKPAAGIFLLATIGLMAAVEVLKDTLRVPRPDYALIEASGYALPSGHAAGSIYLAIMLSCFASRLKKPLRYGIYVAFGLAALAIGISRFQLGVHTPFQIATGYTLGTFFAVTCISFMRKAHLGRSAK